MSLDVKKYWELSPDGNVAFHIQADVEPHLDFAKHLRDQKGPKGNMFPSKRDFHHAAHVPAEIITKILAEDGVNFFNRNDLPKFMQILKEKYPHFITVPHNVLKGR